jgi:hypothetical protein
MARDRVVVLAHRLLWCAMCVRYSGGMAMRFTATVKNHEVVIRGVDLRDGEVVDVTIESQDERDDYELSAEELREIELGEAEVAAGRTVDAHEAIAWIDKQAELRRQAREGSRPGNQPRSRRVGASRSGAKQATRRRPGSR